MKTFEDLFPTIFLVASNPTGTLIRVGLRYDCRRWVRDALVLSGIPSTDQKWQSHYRRGLILSIRLDTSSKLKP